MLPVLFYLILRRVLDVWEIELYLRGVEISNMPFVDDTTLPSILLPEKNLV